MSAVALTKQQLKGSLAAKKQKKAATKNVLATPFTSYWPLLSPEDNNTIKEVLENCLPLVKQHRPKIPFQEIKKIPKEERKKFREGYGESLKVEINSSESANIIFGVNEVTKGLEAKVLIAVLVASDVQPRLMVQHIVDMCVLNNIPVLIVEGLRDLLKAKCGVSSLVVALRNPLTTETKLFLVYDAVKQVFENYPIPEKHINSLRSQDKIENEARSISDEKMDVEVMEQCVESEPSSSLEKTSEDRSHFNSRKTDSEIRKSIYLIRTTPDKPVFVPRRSSASQPQYKMEIDNTGFIALSSDTTGKQPVIKNSTSKAPHTGENLQSKSGYKSLLLKKLKGDPNRNKRKIDMLKPKNKL